MAIGSGISQAQGTSEAKPAEIGKEVYLEHCASCHIPIPPEVLPTQTWQELLEKPQNHYGENLKDIISITQRLIWEYLRLYSRPLNPEEKTPMYIAQSRYFKALHPRVEVPKPVNHQSCNSCHIGVQNLDYRSLTPPWENSP
ncbi:MAG: cytochrome [Gomphosphaeria aponina SAG 52.96 = DSM 107014]|uniref:Cytochrome n=1 Tax=Gomphosphaeria aponina SAG 52.96 = DSM 107014 TaxID=1521640 RepID=A0A941GQN9_9CHRO|nr:cytochrome [Gomphosphaeria aponina SAG 52.96 = DSM 107014]